MKRFSYLFISLIILSCSSLHNTKPKTSVCGTYYFFDENKREILLNWTKITLLPKGSFVLIVPYMNKGKEVYGKWYMRNDTLTLSTDYSHLDMNFVEKGVQNTGDDIHLSIKIHGHDDFDLSEYMLTMIIDSVSYSNDTTVNFVYYNIMSNHSVTTPFNIIKQARGIALVHKNGHFIEYYGSMKERLNEIKKGHLYDLIFMGFGSTYPILVNDTFHHVDDTLMHIINNNDSLNYHVKYVKSR